MAARKSVKKAEIAGENERGGKKFPRIRHDRPIALLAAWYAVIFAALCLAIRAATGGIRSYGSGLYAALCFSSLPAAALYPLYLAATFAAGAGVRAIIAAAAEGAIIAAAATLMNRLGRKPLWAEGLTVAVGRCAYIVAAVSSGEAMIAAAELCFSLAFAYVSSRALAPVVQDALSRKATATELACLALTFAVLSAGLATLRTRFFVPLYAAGLAAVALSSRLAGRVSAPVAGVVVGLGEALFTGNIDSVALFAIVGCAYAAFEGAPRPLAVTAAILTAVAVKMYFAERVDGLICEFVSLAVGGAAFCIIPKAKLALAREKYFSPPSHLALRAMLASEAERCRDRIERVGEVYGEMSRLVARRGEIEGCSAEEIADALSRVCEDCDRCRGRESERDDAIAQLGARAHGGGAAVADVPFFIENDCPHAARLFSAAGELADRAASMRREAGRDNAVRSEVGARLGGVKSAMHKVAESTAAPRFDLDLEDRVREELCYCGAGAADVLAADGRVTAVVKSGGEDGESRAEEIAKSLSGVMGGPLSATVKPSIAPGYEVVELTRRTEYDAVFACANVSKSRDATGDAHSFMRVGESKFMLALSDGMGFGRGASRLSDDALGLIECFFRAGLDAHFALSQVNAFLSRDGGEGFSAFDLMLCDLRDLSRTVIKLGSPASYIKNKRAVTRLEGRALPLGALPGYKPAVIEDVASDGDTMVFVSDGISDLFEGDSLAHLLARLPSANLQSMCESVVAAARERAAGEIRDDMTVVAATVFRRL